MPPWLHPDDRRHIADLTRPELEEYAAALLAFLRAQRREGQVAWAPLLAGAKVWKEERREPEPELAVTPAVAPEEVAPASVPVAQLSGAQAADLYLADALAFLIPNWQHLLLLSPPRRQNLIRWLVLAMRERVPLEQLRQIVTDHVGRMPWG